MARALSGRCYYGRVHVSAPDRPTRVAACHCDDCRRWTGAPLAAFAAFDTADVLFDPPLGAPRTQTDTVSRWICIQCGTPLRAEFSYLPGQIYVPLGLLDQAPDLVPQIAAYCDMAMPWVHLSHEIDTHQGSARRHLGLDDPGGAAPDA